MKMERLIAIITILAERKRIRAKELAEMFEVSKRTIYRDIETINLAGIPIFSTSGSHGGFQIIDQYKMDKKIFTTSDIVALLIGIESLATLPINQKMLPTLAKLKSLIPHEANQEIQNRSTQIAIDLAPWMESKPIQFFFDTIKDALERRLIITFIYYDRYNEKSSRSIEPYRLILKENHWYVQGYCHTRKDFRLFKLSRISDLKITSSSFSVRELPTQYDSFSKKATEHQIPVTLKINKAIMDQIMDNCSEDCILEEGDSYFIVQIPFIPGPFSYSIILSFGDQCECLDPKEFREEIARQVHQLSQIYSPN